MIYESAGRLIINLLLRRVVRLLIIGVARVSSEFRRDSTFRCFDRWIEIRRDRWSFSFLFPFQVKFLKREEDTNCQTGCSLLLRAIKAVVINFFPKVIVHVRLGIEKSNIFSGFKKS